MDDWFLDSVYKFFLNQTTLNLRKEKWGFLNRELTVVAKVLLSNLYTVGMWDKDLVNAPNLKVSWLWLVDPPQNQQDCTFFALFSD